MIDETLLDEPHALVRADSRGLLRAVAGAGAHVRTAARAADESPVARLTPDDRPGTLLIAGTGPAVPLAAGLLAALAGDGVRVAPIEPTGPFADPGALTWHLPRWVGPLDLLLILSADGAEPGLTLLLEAAYRRGCATVTVAPEISPLAEATAHRRGLGIPYGPAPHAEPADHPLAPGPAWALIAPLLPLGDRLGLFTAPAADVLAMADRLDAVAERCGPTTRTHDNVAKALAAEFAATVPLLWSEGPLAHAAARHAAATLTGLAARPALAAPVPGAFTEHGALLGGSLVPGADPDDFFRDRVEEPQPLRARVLLLSDTDSEAPPDPAAPENAPGAPRVPGAASAARALAFERGVAFSELAFARGGGPLETAAEFVAQLDFAAVYLALAAGSGS
ncbi:SIS domain-containing protein [Streptomyces radicis]|uniref:Mannose-6-phosphate isomerase n=1 Tax=Streptomyces radicis TaxID=1750517 RepID=A0A3A9W6D4_9ACTN|nr:SIS domain-containing protein [Streptomyces radicis]RKN08755.1 mannose-6-phosphate isomerase [Streptomyces radicis]RKN21913.1 mannose-6-phosphate isomerase [Streptomyces radicis]